MWAVGHPWPTAPILLRAAPAPILECGGLPPPLRPNAPSANHNPSPSHPAHVSCLDPAFCGQIPVAHPIRGEASSNFHAPKQKRGKPQGLPLLFILLCVSSTNSASAFTPAWSGVIFLLLSSVTSVLRPLCPLCQIFFPCLFFLFSLRPPLRPPVPLFLH